jgi:hypothetical protein
MEQSLIRPKIERRNSQDIKVLLEEFAKASISIEAFCNKHNIGKSTFHKWQSRYKHKGTQPGTSAAFADIHIMASGEHATALFAEVNGIKLYRPVTAAYLKELLL